MTKELAKTLTTALVQFIDRERPEGTMDCSSGECEKIEKAFVDYRLDIVDGFIRKKLSRMTEFEEKLVSFALQCGGQWDTANEEAKKWSRELLDLVKKELLSYADESNPAIEAMADLERTFECNPDKLPGWLKDELNKAFKKGQESSHEDYMKGYTKGYEVATKLCNESVAYHFPTMPTTPVFGCDGTHCTNPQMDCINCPRKTTGGMFSTSSGTSTATLHGNTSATDGKEHNPSFTD